MTKKKDPRELVRVTDSLTGAQYSIRRHAAEADSKRYTILDRPAVDPITGKPVPPKPKSVTEEAPQVTKPAATPKEK